jgi:uncharacterized protein
VTTDVATTLESLAKSHDMLLETRKRDGTWVPTAVHPVVEGDHIFFRTWSTSGKAKRLRHTTDVRVAPCTPRGRRTGAQLAGRARRLEGRDADHAASLINRRYPVLQGVAVRIYHRLRGLTTQHYVVTDLH